MNQQYENYIKDVVINSSVIKELNYNRYKNDPLQEKNMNEIELGLQKLDSLKSEELLKSTKNGLKDVINIYSQYLNYYNKTKFFTEVQNSASYKKFRNRILDVYLTWRRDNKSLLLILEYVLPIFLSLIILLLILKYLIKSHPFKINLKIIDSAILVVSGIFILFLSYLFYQDISSNVNEWRYYGKNPEHYK